MKVGEQISHYILEEKIGDGGFGDVYRARDATTGMEVAIKCSRPDACESKLTDREQRFMREVSCISKLRHQNIVQLFDYGSLPDGTLFLVMEYICGLNLEVLIKRDAPFSYVYASEIVLQVLDALDEAHRQGIVHRDLKPANIMLVRQGLRSDFVKLLDFGIAKAFNGTEPDLTRQNFQNGAGFGTPQYMPPEQFYGKKIGPHTDLYAVGLVFYELLTGKQAFTGKTLSELIDQQLNKFPDIPAPFNQGPLFDIFRRALAKQISMRYASAQEMYQDIDAITRFHSPFLEKYSSAAGASRSSALEAHAPAPKKVEYSDSDFDKDEEASTVDTLIFAENMDISDYNTLVFDGIVRTSSSKKLSPPAPVQEAIVFGGDELDEIAELAPTDDMSRVDPAVALQSAYELSETQKSAPVGKPANKPLVKVPSFQSASPVSSAPSLKSVPPTVSPVRVAPSLAETKVTSKPKEDDHGLGKRIPNAPAVPMDVIDAGDMPTHLMPEMNSSEMDINTNALPLRPDLANVARGDIHPIDEPDISQLNTLMVDSDQLPEEPKSEDLPPVFHEQRTNFIRKNQLQPLKRPTYLGEETFINRLLYRIQMSRVGTAFLNSGFYRACRHGHHRISVLIDELYADHFPELVAAVCIIIIILTLVIAMLVM